MSATGGTGSKDGARQAQNAGADADVVNESVTSPAPRRYSRGTRAALIAGVALVLLLVGGTLGLALSGTLGNDASASPDNASVDAGFARDMIVHHDQGVLMAHYAEQNTDDQEISVTAYDLGYTQTDQLGQMQGWLSLWDLPEFGDGTHMGWMGRSGSGHDGMGSAAMGSSAMGSAAAGSGAMGSGAASGSPLMPGMATSAEIQKLRGLKGAESDTYFLQLMIRHHQGGAPMMQYAAEHAANPVVRNFAGKMAQSQSAEISVMTQMLALRGAEPLPAPG